MRCEICTNDPYALLILPIKQPDGKLNTIACNGCAYESEHYCHKHDKANMGFIDGTSACGTCVEEVVEEGGQQLAIQIAIRAEDAPNRSEIKEVVDEYLAELQYGLEHLSFTDLPLAVIVSQTTNAQNIARPIVAYSFRKKLPIEAAISKSLERPAVVFLGLPDEA